MIPVLILAGFFFLFVGAGARAQDSDTILHIGTPTGQPTAVLKNGKFNTSSPTGSLEIPQTETLQVKELRIGGEGSTGHVTVRGTVQASGTVFVGGNGVQSGGAGFLAILNKVLLSEVGTLSIHGRGTVSLKGALATNSIATSHQSQKIILDGGTLQVKRGSADEGQDESMDITGPGALYLGEDGGTINTDGGKVHISSPIEGAGKLKVIGGGDLRLAGKNSYSGPTEVYAAKVIQNAAGALSPNSAMVLYGDSTLDLRGYNAVIGGLSGEKASEVTNTGHNHATLDVQCKDDTYQEFPGTIQNGSGGLSLHKSGGGTLKLSGTNSYTGGTMISEGTLIGTTSSLQGNIENKSKLVFEQSDLESSGVYAGNISGTGKVIINSPDKALIFMGTNTYRGGTEITAGTLIGTTSSLQGNIQNEGELVFAQSGLESSGVYAGNISGAGKVIINSPSQTLKFTGTNTYKGGTEITAGTLIGTTFSLQGNIQNESELVFAQSGTSAFTGIISGSGTMRINSPWGGIEFDTNQVYRGPTIIQSGALSVNAQLQSSTVFIQPGGILSGMGTLHGNVINSGMISGSGQDRLALKINGNYTQKSQGTLVIKLSSEHSYDQLTVKGKAHLDGKLQVKILRGFKPDFKSEYTILTAEQGVEGKFSTSDIPNDSSFESEPVYNLNNVQLKFKFGKPVFRKLNSNQQSTLHATNATVGDQKQNVGSFAEATAGLAEIVAVADQQQDGTNDPAGVAATQGTGDDPASAAVEQIGRFLDQLIPLLALNIKDILFNATNTQYGQITTRLAAIRSGVQGVSLQGLSGEPMAQQLSQHESKVVDKRGVVLAYLPESSHWDIFATASGVFSKIDNAHDLPRINSTTGYFCAGADYRINESMNLGVYTGYQGSRASYSNGAWLRSNGVKFGLYGTAQWRGFYMNAIVGGGANFVNLNRSITTRSRNWVARSYPFAGELDSLLGGGYEFNVGPWRFGANTSVQYTYLGISSFQERGAGTLNVRGGSHNPSSLVYTLGGSIAYLWEIFPGYQVLPTVGLAWQHEFLNYGQRILGQFANGAGAAFYFSTPSAARNNAFGVAGVTAQLGRHTQLYGYYTPQFGGGQIVSHGVLVGLVCSF